MSVNTLLDIDALRRQEPAACQELYDRFFVPLQQLSYGIVLNSGEAEDIVQECFIELLVHIDRFREEASVATYLHRMVINRSLNVRRGSKIRELFVPKYIEAKAAEEEELLPEELQQLHKALKRLPTRQAQAVALFYYERLTAWQTAEKMNTTEAAVEQLLKRARERLEKELKRYRITND